MKHLFNILLVAAIAHNAMAQTPQPTTTAASHRRYVTTTGNYSNGGTSWEDAKNNIQDAINDLVTKGALPGEVWVAQGTYKPTESTETGGGSSLYASFKVPAGITVRGGFQGDESQLNDRIVAYYDASGNELETTTVGGTPSQDYFVKRYKYQTILSGDLTQRQASFTWSSQSNQFTTQFYGNTYHVVWFADAGFYDDGRAKPLNLVNESYTATVEAVFIQHGYAYNTDLDGHPHNAYGGGAYMVKGSMLRDVWITGCEASRDGGAVYMDGGGICDHVYVLNSQAMGVGTSNGRGGGVCIETNPAISQSGPATTMFQHGAIVNCAARQGGGLAILTEQTDITETTTNPVTGVTETTTRSPEAHEDQRNRTAAYASLVANNVATIEGGGVYTNGGGALSQMTIVRNACYGTSTTVDGVMQGRSGGLYARDKVTLQNSVLWGNVAENNKDVQFANSISQISNDLKAQLSYCLIQEADRADWSSAVKVSVNSLSTSNAGSASNILYPRFINPAAEGGHLDNVNLGLGETLSLPYDYRIHNSSACVNAGLFSRNLDLVEEGTNTYPFSSLTHDIRGRNYQAYATIGAYKARSYSTTMIHPQAEKTEDGIKYHDLYVDPQATSGYEDSGYAGSSWTYPLRFLNNALAYVSAQTDRSETNIYRIHVKQGTVRNVTSFSDDVYVRRLSFNIPSYTQILGSYDAELTGTDLDATRRNPLLYSTTITGTTVTDNYNMSALHLLTLDDGAVGVLVDGVSLQYANATSTILSGNSDLTPARHYGAAILMEGASQATFRNLFIKGCTAPQGAAAWLGGSAVASFENVVIYNNEARAGTQPMGIVYTEDEAQVSMDHCDLLHNVGYVGLLTGTSTIQTYYNSVFHANMQEPVDDYRDYPNASNPTANFDKALPAFAYRALAGTTPAAANGTLPATDKLVGTHCFFDAQSDALKGTNFDDLTSDRRYKYQYSLSYVYNTDDPENGYPRFVNATKNAGVSTAGDVTFYGRSVSFEPSNMNPIVNAAGVDDADHEKWGTDLTTQVRRDYGGSPDVGALENHVNTSGLENAYADGQPEFGEKIYVRAYEDEPEHTTKTGNFAGYDGTSWSTAIDGNAMYKSKQDIYSYSVTTVLQVSTSVSNPEHVYRIYNARAGGVNEGYATGSDSHLRTRAESQAADFVFISAGNNTYYGVTLPTYYIYDLTNRKYVTYASSYSGAEANPMNESNASNATWYILQDETSYRGGGGPFVFIPGSVNAYNANRRNSQNVSGWNAFRSSANTATNVGAWTTRNDAGSHWYIQEREVVLDDVELNGFQYALNLANSRFKEDGETHEVWVGAGTYDQNNSAQLTMMEGADALGGFPATGNPGKDERNISNDATNAAAYMTIITPQPGNRGLYHNSTSFADRTKDGQKVYTMFEGFTITGASTENGVMGAGAMIQKNGMLKNCLISKNTYHGTAGQNDVGGAGLYITAGSLVKNCIIRQNLAYKASNRSGAIRGAGVYSQSGELQNSLIVENLARHEKTSSLGTGDNVLGAGLFVASASKLYNCTVAYNEAIVVSNKQYNNLSEYLAEHTTDNSLPNAMAVAPGIWDGGVGRKQVTWTAATETMKKKWPRMQNWATDPYHTGVYASANELVEYYTGTSDFYNCIFWGNIGNSRRTEESVLQVAMGGYTNGAGFDPDHMYTCYSSAANNATAVDAVTDNTVWSWRKTEAIGASSANNAVTRTALLGYLAACHNAENSPFLGDSEAFVAGTLTYELKSSGNAGYCINMGANADMIQNDLGLTEDIAGADRVQDCQIDKGAYEFNGAANITPQLLKPGADATSTNRVEATSVDDATEAVFYVMPDNITGGLATASSPYNAACASKLQYVLDAAGRYKYFNPTKRVIVKIADNGLEYPYAATHTTRINDQDVRLYSIQVPRGVEVWGGYDDFHADLANFTETNNGFWKANDDGELVDQRDVVQHKVIFNSVYKNKDAKTNVTTYHVVTFTDRIYQATTTRLPYAKGDEPNVSGTATATRQSGAGNYLSLGAQISDRAVIDGLYVRGGKADIPITNIGSTNVLNANRYGGAAIVKKYAHVRNCILEENTAINGGALALMPGALVSGTLFRNNQASQDGGAIYIFQEDNAVNLMESSDGISTSALPTDAELSAGNSYDHKMAHVFTSTIAANQAQRGGGIFMTTDEANVRFNSSVIWQNTAPDQSNIYGLYNPATLPDNVVQEYFPFNYCAAQEIRLTGISNIQLNIDNNGGARFIAPEKDLQGWPVNVDSRELSLDNQDLATTADFSQTAQFAEDYNLFGLTNYSVLTNNGMPMSDYVDTYVNQWGLSLVDLMGTGRNLVHSTQHSQGHGYIDIGARAFVKEIPSSMLMLRLYVTTPEQVNMTAAEQLMKLPGTTDVEKYYRQEGSSLGYPMQSLQQALDYIRDQRTPDATGKFHNGVEHVNDLKFFIYLTGGTYTPTESVEGSDKISSTNTFSIPEGVSIVGGMSVNRSLKNNNKDWSASTETDEHPNFVPVNSRIDANNYTFLGGYYEPQYTAPVDGQQYYIDNNSIRVASLTNQHAQVVEYDGIKFHMIEVHPDTISKNREMLDVNSNNIVEPWEFKYETILSGNVTGTTQGVHHIVTIAPDENYVGMLPTPVWLAAEADKTTDPEGEKLDNYYVPAYVNDGHHHRMKGQPVALDGLVLQEGYAMGWNSDYKETMRKFSYYHGGAILVDGNMYCDELTTKYGAYDVDNIGTLTSTRRGNPQGLTGRNYMHANSTNALAYREVPLVVLNCKLKDNEAGYGGAISTNSGLSVINSTFERNRVVAGEDNLGEAVSITTGDINVHPIDGKTLDETALSTLTYPGQGGAIYATAQLQAYNTMFANNEARASLDDSQNGQIYNQVSKTFRRPNNAEFTDVLGMGGAIMMGVKGYFHIINCDIVNNQACAYPAVFTKNPNVSEMHQANPLTYNQFVNSIIWGNRVNDGVIDYYTNVNTNPYGSGLSNEGQRLLYNVGLICNYALLREKAIYGTDLWDQTTWTKTDPFVAIDQRAESVDYSSLGSLLLYNPPMAAEGFFVCDDNKTAGGFSDADLGKRIFAETAWFSAYEEDRGIPAVNDYENYRDMEYSALLHMVPQLLTYRDTQDPATLADKTPTIPETHYQNSNIQISSVNVSDDGPNFGNPSTKAGYAGYNSSADWSPARLNVLTDAGSGYIRQDISTVDGEYVTTFPANDHPDFSYHYNYYGEEIPYNTRGVYPMTKYYSDSRLVRRMLPIGEDRYMFSNYTNASGNQELLRISKDPNPSHKQTYIDIGVYEYRHVELRPQTGDAVDILWVSSKEKKNGLPEGSSWLQPTSDLQRAIETLLASRNGHRKEIRLMGGSFTPNYTINGHSAFYVNTLLLNQSTILDTDLGAGYGVSSLTIKGGYDHDLNGVYDIKEYPSTIRQRQRTNETSSLWDRLIYIDDPTQRYGSTTYDPDVQGHYRSGDVGTHVRTIPIEIYGVKLINDQARPGVQGSVIYYPDYFGYNNEADAAEGDPDKAPEIEGTSTAWTTWYADGESHTAQLADGQAPKLVIGSTIVYGSGNESDFQPGAAEEDREQASAVYIGKNGGHALLYNTVFHSNQAHPLLANAPTRVVNNTFAINGMEPVLHAEGDDNAERNDTLKSRIFNSVFWRNNPTKASPTKNEEFGAQFQLKGVAYDQLSVADNTTSGGRFERNSYTGGFTESNNYETAGELDKRHFNTGLAYENTDLMNGPNFVNVFTTVGEGDAATSQLVALEERDFDISPSQRLMNKGDNDRYIREYNTDEGADNSNYIYDMAWIQKEDGTAKVAGTTINIEKDEEQRNGPQFDAAYRDRFSRATNIDLGAYEYQNALRRVLYVRTNTAASTGDSWEESLSNIQNAVDMAALYHSAHPREQAFVFVGGLGTTSALHTGQSVTLREGVSIYGGMNPSGATMKEQSIKTGEDTYESYYKDEDIISYLNDVERYANRTPVGALGFFNTIVTGIATSDEDVFAPFDHENKYTQSDVDNGIIEADMLGTPIVQDPRLQVRALIDGFAVMPNGNATPLQSPLHIDPKVYQTSVSTRIDTIVVRRIENTQTNEVTYMERRVAKPAEGTDLTAQVASGSSGDETWTESYKQYTTYPSVALRNIIVADWKMPANTDVAYFDQSLLYNALLRDNTTSGTGATLRLGSRGYAMSVTATGTTVGSDGSTTLNNRRADHYHPTYDLDGDGTKETDIPLECNLHKGTSHVYFSLTNFEGNGDLQQMTQRSLVRGLLSDAETTSGAASLTIRTSTGTEDPNLSYQHIETSPYIDLDAYDVISLNYSHNNAHKDLTEFQVVSDDAMPADGSAAEGWLSMANPWNFLPLNLRDFVHLRTNDETTDKRPSDSDILGNPRLPYGLTGANDKLDRGCFETWFQRSTYETNAALGRYPHPGSVVYIQNRYAYHPAHADDVSKLYNDADLDVSLSLDVAIEPGALLMQEGTSLYGNGHAIHTKNMAFERTVSLDKGTIVALPFAIDYYDEKKLSVWDVTHYGGSLKGKVNATVDRQRAQKDKIYGYNSQQRSQWNNIFEATNSSKWKELTTQAERNIEAAHGVLYQIQNPMTLGAGYTANADEALANNVRVYRFMGNVSGAGWGYAEEGGQTSKTVQLKQYDDHSSTGSEEHVAGDGDFTNAEDMGWNLIGIPYAVNTYYPHRRANALSEYALSTPHKLWIYYDGDYSMINEDMVNTNFGNDTYALAQKVVDEGRKSKGGYYAVDSWSDKFEDWNQEPIVYPFVGVYNKADKTTSGDNTTYKFHHQLVTDEPLPRLWMGEGFFTQTAAVNEEGIENLVFDLPLYPGRGVAACDVTKTYVTETGQEVGGGGVRGFNDALRSLLGPNYRIYNGPSLDEPADDDIADEVGEGIQIHVRGRHITVTGLEPGQEVIISDPSGRIHNIIRASGYSIRTAVATAGVFIIKAEDKVARAAIK